MLSQIIIQERYKINRKSTKIERNYAMIVMLSLYKIITKMGFRKNKQNQINSQSEPVTSAPKPIVTGKQIGRAHV